MDEPVKLSPEDLAKIDEALQKIKMPGTPEYEAFHKNRHKLDEQLEKIIENIEKAERFTGEDWNTFVGGCDE